MAVKNDIEMSPIDKTTKQRIFEVSLDLFAQKGFDAVSMREIAEAVGIKKASVYSHFASKDELIEQIFNYPSMALEIVGPKGENAEKMIVSMGVEGFMAMACGVTAFSFASSIARRAMSTPVMSQPFSARNRAFSPVPQPTSRMRPHSNSPSRKSFTKSGRGRPISRGGLPS